MGIHKVIKKYKINGRPVVHRIWRMWKIWNDYQANNCLILTLDPLFKKIPEVIIGMPELEHDKGTGKPFPRFSRRLAIGIFPTPVKPLNQKNDDPIVRKKLQRKPDGALIKRPVFLSNYVFWLSIVAHFPRRVGFFNDSSNWCRNRFLDISRAPIRIK